MAGRCLPNPVTVLRWVPVTPVIMSTSSWAVSCTGSLSLTVRFRSRRQGPHRTAGRKSCILTGVGSETMALSPSPTLSTSLIWTTAWKSTSSWYKMGRYARKRGWVCGHKLRIVDSFVQTDVFSKRCRSYLLPYNCYALSVLRGSSRKSVRDYVCFVAMIILLKKDWTSVDNTSACLVGSRRQHRKYWRTALQNKKD